MWDNLYICICVQNAKKIYRKVFLLNWSWVHYSMKNSKFVSAFPDNIQKINQFSEKEWKKARKRERKDKIGKEEGKKERDKRENRDEIENKKIDNKKISPCNLLPFNLTYAHTHPTPNKDMIVSSSAVVGLAFPSFLYRPAATTTRRRDTETLPTQKKEIGGLVSLHLVHLARPPRRAAVALAPKSNQQCNRAFSSPF